MTRNTGSEGAIAIRVTLGYGFGYTLRSSAQIVLVMDRSFILHQREGLSGDQSSRTDQSIIRAGLRFGFGRK